MQARRRWAGAFVSSVGSWTQDVALSWLIHERYHDPFYLSLRQFAAEAPLIAFMALGGAVAVGAAVDQRRWWPRTEAGACLAAGSGALIKAEPQVLVYWDQGRPPVIVTRFWSSVPKKYSDLVESLSASEMSTGTQPYSFSQKYAQQW